MSWCQAASHVAPGQGASEQRVSVVLLVPRMGWSGAAALCDTWVH